MIFRRRGSSGVMIGFASLQKAGAHLQTLSVVSNIRYECGLIFSEAQTCHGEEEGEYEVEKRDIFERFFPYKAL